MSRARAFADQDTSIFEHSLTANTGASPILQLSNIFDGSILRKEFSRVLVRFSLSSLTGGITNKDYPDSRTDSTVSAYLYLFNAPHGDIQAQSFDLNVHPITQNWSEGTGLDVDMLNQTGYANAVSAMSSNVWTTTGGTYVVDSNSATQQFNTGEENLRVNITNIFNAWINGNTANHGLIIKMSDANEIKTGSNSAVNIYYKKFYGRETNTRRKPFIQLEWNGAINDFRNFVEYSSTANLFFYNIKNGQVIDLAGSSAFPGNVTISGLSGTSWSAITTGLTAARNEKGVYSANFNLPLTANAFSQYKDNWYLSAAPTANYTFVFTAINPSSGFDNFVTSKYRVVFKNLRSSYEKGTISRLRMNIKDDSLTLVALTAATTAVSNFICTNGTYQIRELVSDLIEQDEVSLSYDTNGNFFTLNTSNLYVGCEYKIVLKLNIRGETFYYDQPDTWRFKVV